MDEKYVITVKGTVIITEECGRVYDAITNIGKWNTLSKHFKQIEMIIKDNNKMLTRLVSHHNKMDFARYTFRMLEPNKHMKFTHLNSSFPIKQHYGKWLFREVPEGTEVTIEHNFSVFFSILGYWLGILIIAPYFFRKPSRQMLNEIKETIEKRRGRE
jgi:hypothetical protein